MAVRPLKVEDVTELAGKLRMGDRAEILAAMGPYAHGNVFFEAIVQSIEMSSMNWTGTVNGEVACVFGVGPASMITGTGRPWLLATDLFDKETVSIGRLMRVYLARMLREYPHLENWVFSQNLKAVKWLQKLGFTMHPAAPWGAVGAPFHRFEMETR